MLSRIAASLSVAGRVREAELVAEHAVADLADSYSATDPRLLSPLQTLAVVQFELGKLRQAAATLRRMNSIPLSRPEDCALVTGIATAMLEASGNLDDAEAGYLQALAAFRRAGRAYSAEGASVLTFLGSLYIKQHRLQDAEQITNEALQILTGAPDTVPLDLVKLLNIRGVLHANTGEWQHAQDDFQRATVIADGDKDIDPVFLRPLWANYVAVLRRNHRRHEARALEQRLARLEASDAARLTVSLKDLAGRSR